MQLGDFTELAKYYDNRPGYSDKLIHLLYQYVQSEIKHDLKIADVGAGTGILTKMLWEQGCCGYAVEPNDAMRKKVWKNLRILQTLYGVRVL